MARLWSAMTRSAVSVSSSLPYSTPASRAAFPIKPRNRSPWKLERTPWQTAVMRSSPMPVSMLGRGRGTMLPFSSRSYCMNTRFQISRNRSQSHLPMPQLGPQLMSSPWSTWISEQGPQGPVSPMDQKLSFSPSR